jgi:hypothetical protein
MPGLEIDNTPINRAIDGIATGAEVADIMLEAGPPTECGSIARLPEVDAESEAWPIDELGSRERSPPARHHASSRSSASAAAVCAPHRRATHGHARWSDRRGVSVEADPRVACTAKSAKCDAKPLNDIEIEWEKNYGDEEDNWTQDGTRYSQDCPQDGTRYSQDRTENRTRCPQDAHIANCIAD